MVCRHYVTIQVGGRRHLAVPGNVHGDAHQDALRQQKRRSVVSQVVEALLRWLSRCERIVEASDDIARPVRFAEDVGKDETLIPQIRGGGIERLSVEVPPVGVDGNCWQREGAPALLCLWLLEDKLGLDSLPGGRAVRQWQLLGLKNGRSLGRRSDSKPESRALSLTTTLPSLVAPLPETKWRGADWGAAFR